MFSTMNFLKDIEAALRKEIPAVPKEWKSMAQLEKEFRLSSTTILKYIRKFLEQGVYESKKFPVFVSGKVIKIVHYHKKHA